MRKLSMSSSISQVLSLLSARAALFSSRNKFSRFMNCHQISYRIATASLASDSSSKRLLRQHEATTMTIATLKW
ncbi:hypothetical protein IW261DRAFT_1443376 [Armillaria novae-zelandiae]|uniref:Uncharacterized protein n=1 Tax=Armillaria novae-zelandiae TaxID=153914 RepID=A0AA39PT47_9AGAR|nr:hypothetical protein IW261DRAFT_1443376 [Armillaria novae-zelandiae]